MGDRERWEKGFQPGTQKRKKTQRKNPQPTSRQKAMKSRRAATAPQVHHFDDMPIPTIQKGGVKHSRPQSVQNFDHDEPLEQVDDIFEQEDEGLMAPLEVEQKEDIVTNQNFKSQNRPTSSASNFHRGHVNDDFYQENENNHPAPPESVLTTTTTTTFRKKKYPSCSHHVSSLFPQQQNKKPILARQRKKIMQQQFAIEETTRRLRKEHEQEAHQLKEKIKKLNSLVNKYKLNCKNLTTEKETMKKKLDKFESEQNKNLTE